MADELSDGMSMEAYAAARAKGVVDIAPPSAAVAAPEPAAEPEPAAASEPDGAAAEPEVEATEAEPAAAETALAATPPAPKPQSGINERLSKMAADRDAAAARAAAADARVDTLARSLEEATAAIKALQPKPAEPPPVPVDERPVRPDRMKFDDPDAYEAAMTTHLEEVGAWAARGAVRQRDQEQETRQRETAAAEAQKQATESAEANRRRVMDSWNERRTAALTKYPDFADVVETDAVPINEVMASMIMQHEQGPEIAYYLGQHPEEAARIAGMNSNQVFPPGHERAGQPFPDIQRQIFEMGRVAAKLETPVVATPPRVPRPPATLNGNSSPGEKPYDQMTTEEYARATGRDRPGTTMEYRRQLSRPMN